MRCLLSHKSESECALEQPHRRSKRIASKCLQQRNNKEIKAKLQEENLSVKYTQRSSSFSSCSVDESKNGKYISKLGVGSVSEEKSGVDLFDNSIEAHYSW